MTFFKNFFYMFEVRGLCELNDFGSIKFYLKLTKTFVSCRADRELWGATAFFSKQCFKQVCNVVLEPIN